MSWLDSHTMVPTDTMFGRLAGGWGSIDHGCGHHARHSVRFEPLGAPTLSPVLGVARDGACAPDTMSP